MGKMTLIPSIICALLMFTTACQGKPYSKVITVPFVPNVNHIDQVPSGSQIKHEIDVEIYLQPTKSPNFSLSQNENDRIEQEGNGIGQETLDQIFGTDTVTGVESSTSVNKVIGQTDDFQKESSGVGLIDVRSGDKVVGIQGTQRRRQGFNRGSQNLGPTKNQFATSTNIPYGSDGNSPNGQDTSETSTTPSFQAGTKGNQPNPNPNYPIFRPENQGGSSQPTAGPTYPVFGPINQNGNSQSGVGPTYPGPGSQDVNSRPGVGLTYQTNRPRNQGGRGQPGVNPTYPITGPGNQVGNSQPGVSPTNPIIGPGKQGGSSQPRGKPTYPIFQPSNEGSIHWPNIQLGVNTAGPGGQGGVLPVSSGYWPDIQFGGYYSPHFMPGGQGGFGYHDWVGNSQGVFNGYPNGPEYGWPYTQNAFGYGNEWHGFGGQEARPYHHNHDRLNGQEHHHSHHHHQRPGGEHHGYHFHYNNNRDC